MTPSGKVLSVVLVIGISLGLPGIATADSIPSPAANEDDCSPIIEAPAAPDQSEPGGQVVIDASDSNADLVRVNVDGDGSFDRTNGVPVIINLNQSWDSRMPELIESGGVVIETDDEEEAQALAEHLREAGSNVEIEQRDSQPNATEEVVVLIYC